MRKAAGEAASFFDANRAGNVLGAIEFEGRECPSILRAFGVVPETLGSLLDAFGTMPKAFAFEGRRCPSIPKEFGSMARSSSSALHGISIVLNGFSTVLNGFSIVPTAFSIVLTGFSIVLIGFGLVLIGFGIVLFCFSLVPNGFGIVLIGFSLVLTYFSIVLNRLSLVQTRFSAVRTGSSIIRSRFGGVLPRSSIAPDRASSTLNVLRIELGALGAMPTASSTTRRTSSMLLPGVRTTLAPESTMLSSFVTMPNPLGIVPIAIGGDANTLGTTEQVCRGDGCAAEATQPTSGEWLDSVYPRSSLMNSSSARTSERPR